jgi:hypothetical protein
LLDLPRNLLRTAFKLQAPQLGNQQLQVFDLVVVGENLQLLRDDDRLQCLWLQGVQIGHRDGGGNHEHSMP